MIAAHVVYMARLFIGPSRDLYCVFFFSHLCVVKSVMTPITTMTPVSFPEGLLAPLYMHRADYPAKCCGLHLPLLNCILFISTSPMSQSAWTPGLISRGSAATMWMISCSKCNQMQQMHLSTQHPGKYQSQDADSSSTMALPQNPAVEGNQAADKSTLGILILSYKQLVCSRGQKIRSPRAAFPLL